MKKYEKRPAKAGFFCTILEIMSFMTSFSCIYKYFFVSLRRKLC